jgi:RNA polymerase sigma factor (sigma-70 family)
LLERFAALRDESAFAELVRRHGGMVLSVARSVLNDAHGAEDVFQATFLVLARKAASVRKRESVGSWLYGVAYRIARNVRLSAARRRRRERAVSGTAAVAAGEEAMTRELRPLFAEELNRLPEKYRAPLVLCYLEGKTNEEAARELRWPPGTIKGRLARAREVLRSRLARRGLALPAIAVALEATSSAATAAVPGPLAEATVKAAGLYVTGAFGTLSASVLALSETALNEMHAARVRAIVITMTAAVLIGSGIGWAALGSSNPPEASQPGITAREESDAEALPADVRALLGSLRLRHASGVYAVAYARAGDRPRIISGSADGTLGIWDARTGQRLHRLRLTEKGDHGFAGIVGSVAVSDNGDRVAAANYGGDARLWDVESGKVLHTFEATYISLSGDGKLLALTGQKMNGFPLISGAEPKRFIRIHDAETGKEIARWEEPPSVQYQKHLFSPDGKTLVTVGTHTNIEVPGGAVGGFGGGIALGGGFGAGFGGKFEQKSLIHIWDVATGKQVRELADIKGFINAVAFSPDGKLLAAAGDPMVAAPAADRHGEICIWDFETAKEKSRLRGHEHGVSSLAFSPDGKTVASTGSDQHIRVWDVASAKELGSVQASRSLLHSVAFAPDGRGLASGGDENAVKLWDLPSLQQRPIGAGHETWVSFLAFTPDGKRLITGAPRDGLSVWDLGSGRHVGRFADACLQARALSPDCKTALVNDGNALVRLVDAERGKELHVLLKNVGFLYAAAFTPDGKSVLTLHHSNDPMQAAEATLWDAPSGKKVRTFERAVAGMQSVMAADILQYSPDGKILAIKCMSEDSALRLLDADSGRELCRVQNDAVAAVLSGVALAFAPDSHTLALGFHQIPSGPNPAGFGFAAGVETRRGISLHDTRTGREIAHFADVDAELLAFSPDGRLLATASRDSELIHVWELASRKLRCRLSGSPDGVTALAFAPDNKTVVAAGMDTSVLLLDLYGAAPGGRLDARLQK